MQYVLIYQNITILDVLRYDTATYGTAQRQRHKRTQLFCDLRVRIECNECVLSMRTSLDFRIL